MKSLLCLAVGCLKAPCWSQAAEYYAKLLSRYMRLELIVVKDAHGRLSPEQRNEVEGRALLAKLGPKDQALGLDAQGEAYSSEGFAAALEKWLEDPVRRPCFVLGGAFGLSEDVRDRCDQLISLSPLTLPHELARVVLLEQLYRAMSILRGSGYHH
jgi:23S rRNA (pseudouridine1915-N3)-methyltransferase